MLRSMLIAILVSAVAHLNEAQNTHLQVSDCGSEFTCVLGSDTCTTSANCAFMLMYKVNGNQVLAKISAKGKAWLAAGFNVDKTDAMIGTKGVLCKHINGTASMRVFDNTAKDTPTLVTTSTASVTTSGAFVLDGALVCKFSFPYNGNVYIHSLNVTDPMLFVSAWGDQLDSASQAIVNHGQGNYFFRVADVTSKTALYPDATPNTTLNPTGTASTTLQPSPSSIARLTVQPVLVAMMLSTAFVTMK